MMDRSVLDKNILSQLTVLLFRWPHASSSKGIPGNTFLATNNSAVGVIGVVRIC